MSAGNPEVNDGFVDYEPVPFMKWWRWVFGLLSIWGLLFVYACHACVVAGAVAKWYFTRDKDELSSPILGAIRRLIR